MAEGFRSALPKLAGLAFAASSLFGLGGTTAEAQPFFGFFGRTFGVPATLPPEAIYQHLVRYGYQPIGRIERNGRVFLANVIDPQRRQLRLVISSVDGAVLERYVIASRYGAVESPRAVVPVQPDQRATPAKPKPEPRVATRQPAQERVTEHPRSTGPETAPQVIRAPIPEPKAVRAPAPKRAEPTVAEVPAAAAEPAAPRPSVTPAPRREAAPARPAAHPEGPGYANGVPINPLD